MMVVGVTFCHHSGVYDIVEVSGIPRCNWSGANVWTGDVSRWLSGCLFADIWYLWWEVAALCRTPTSNAHYWCNFQNNVFQQKLFRIENHDPLFHSDHRAVKLFSMVQCAHYWAHLLNTTFFCHGLTSWDGDSEVLGNNELFLEVDTCILCGKW